jgi:AraC-like DNA-binding protein
MAVPERDPADAHPEPFARAPRLPEVAEAPRARLLFAPPALHGAIAAIVSRDTRGSGATSAQRLTHAPAATLLCLSWFQDSDAGFVTDEAAGPRWQPFGTELVFLGSQSQPTVSWTSTLCRGGMICFTADAAQALFDIEPAALRDRFVDARTLLDTRWRPFLDALVDTKDDEAMLAVVERYLAPRWQTLQGRLSSTPSLRQLGRHWVERLGWQALEWQRTRSARQVERRIKAWSGRSLREWQALTKPEGAFFAARERHEAGLPVDWATLAQDEGFADQAHLTRATKRLTGFSPGEFARRFVEDESFWLYRLWV